MKVLHVLETSAPDMAGYTIRAQEILEHQRRIGLQVVAITSPLFPSRYAGPPVETLDEVRWGFPERQREGASESPLTDSSAAREAR